MAALSIAIVQGEARKLVSPHLTLHRINSEGCFEWVFSDGTVRNAQRVPTDKIRGLKLDEWLRYARALAEGKPIEGAPPVILNAPVERPTGPAGGANPHFMQIRHKHPARPFNNEDPEAQGYSDAIHGMTANPFGVERQRKLWDKGHDRAYAEGNAELPRFGKIAKRRN